MNKAVLYVRISEDEDINKQINEIIEYTNMREYSLTRAFIDLDKKATNKIKMIEYLENSDIKIILLTSIDRLTRDIKECIKYENMGIKIISTNKIEVIPAMSRV